MNPDTFQVLNIPVGDSGITLRHAIVAGVIVSRGRDEGESFLRPSPERYRRSCIGGGHGARGAEVDAAVGAYDAGVG